MKKLSTVGFIVIFILCLGQTTQSQSPVNRMEKLQAQKIAFFTEKLQLSPAEAEKFWPVYNDYINRKNKLDEESKGLMRYIARNSDNMSENEINESMEKYLRLQEQLYQLFAEYHKKYQQILTPAKVMKIYIAENQFKVVLLNQIRENRPIRR